jgi:hypothetical protein
LALHSAAYSRHFSALGTAVAPVKKLSLRPIARRELKQIKQAARKSIFAITGYIRPVTAGE